MEQTITTDQIIDVLIKARKRVNRRWHKGGFRTDSDASDDTCGVCALGALQYAVTGSVIPASALDWDEYTLYGLASAALHAQVDERFYYAVAYFNDYRDTTKQDVLDLFDRAIDAAKEKQEVEA